MLSNQTNMKKHFLAHRQIHRLLFYAISVVLILSACKKNKSDIKAPVGKTKLIAAVYINDTIYEKYYYKNNRQLTKIEKFSKSGILETIWNYEYDAAGGLKSLKSFTPDGTVKTSHEYTTNAIGQISQSRFKNFTNNYNAVYDYVYDPLAKTKMLSYTASDTVGNKQIKVDYLYNNGMLSGINYSQFLPAGIEMYASSVMQITNDAASLSKYKEVTGSLPEPRPDNWLIDHVAESYKQYYYTSGEVTYEHRAELTEKKYDTKGYVTNLKTTIIKIKPAGPDIVTRLRYEYVDL